MTKIDPVFHQLIDFQTQCSMVLETSQRVGKFYADGLWMDYAFNVIDKDLTRLEQDALQANLTLSRFFELGRQIQEHLHSILALLNTDEHLYLRDRYIKVKGPATRIEKLIVVRFYDTPNKRISTIEMAGAEYFDRLKPIFDPIWANEKPRGEFLLDRFGKTDTWNPLRGAIEEINKLSLVGPSK